MKYNNSKNTVKVLGIDLAKQSFQLHGVDKNSIVVLTKKLTRNKLSQFMAQLPPCLIEICAKEKRPEEVIMIIGGTLCMDLGIVLNPTGS